MSTDNIKDYGIVSAWKRSYGWIKPDGGGYADLFFHSSHVRSGDDFIRPGMRVSYHLAPDRRDPAKVMAVDVVVLG